MTRLRWAKPKQKGDYVKQHSLLYFLCKGVICMSYMKSIRDDILEIMETFSGRELEEKLKATFGYSDRDISNLLEQYGRNA